MDRYPPARPALLDFAAALGSRANALRRDECGDWAIHGRHGKVFAVPEGFQLVVMGWTTGGWNNAKRELAFAKLWQDGEEDGSLILNSLPVDAEAAPIRHWLGIPKRPAFTDEHLAKLRAWGVENARRNASTASPDGQIDAGGHGGSPEHCNGSHHAQTGCSA